MSSELRRRWEERAASRNNACDGVLFKGLPADLNHYLHGRHVHILRRFLALLPERGRLLDIGCGYGRMGAVVRGLRPDIDLYGADFSMNYCTAYWRNVGAPVVGAEVSRLPFAPESFDGLLAVTVLMYVPDGQRHEALFDLGKLLKRGGVILLVDPGEEVQRMVAAVKPAAAHKTTGGKGFALGAIPRLARECDLEVEACGGMPWGTVALPLLYGLIKLGLPVSLVLRGLAERDDRHCGETRWSLHRWAILRRVTSDRGRCS